MQAKKSSNYILQVPPLQSSGGIALLTKEGECSGGCMLRPAQYVQCQETSCGGRHRTANNPRGSKSSYSYYNEGTCPIVLDRHNIF